MEKIKARKKDVPFSKRVLKFFVLILISALAYGALVGPRLLNQQIQIVSVGEVASQEILAPYSVNFESRVYTDAARESAAAEVAPVYLPPDPNIARSQLEKLQNAIYYIATVRSDTHASEIQKIQDLQALPDLQLSEEEYISLLELTEQEWQAIGSEASRVLEIVLRESIRNNQLGTVRSNLPAYIDFAFRSEQAEIIISLVSPYIVPTSLFSEEQTQISRDQARAAVTPVTRQIMAGESLVRRGQIVTEADLEAMTTYGLSEPTDHASLLIKSGIIILIIDVLVIIFFQKNRGQSFAQFNSIILVAVFFLIFLGLARFLVMDRTILPYLFPIAALGLTISIIFTVDYGFFVSFILVVLTVFGHSRSTELILYFMLPTIAGILVVGKARRVSSFLAAGFVISLLSAAVVAAYRIGDGSTDFIGFMTLIGASFFNGLASGTLALLLQNIISSILDRPTALQLMDISRPDHPLLQQILTNSPGTYQHSLQVSNLAEQAADAIGADRLLVRVGTLYHDVGKSENPGFFIENQVQGKINSHDDSDHKVSAATIIKHVTDGVALAKKYRIPSRVIDFIKEHHGDGVARYQYNKALNEAEDPDSVDIKDFTYPGPAPQSKETALVMLADGTEARARANSPRTDEEIMALVTESIDSVKNSGQLDQTDLTLKDLQTIKQSFYNTLKQSYHPRIKYPEAKPAAKPLSAESESSS